MNYSIRQRIAKIIREKRKSKGINQENFAKMVDLSRTSIVNIEKGNHGITIENLYLFAEKLECSVHELIPKPKIRLKLLAPPDNEESTI